MRSASIRQNRTQTQQILQGLHLQVNFLRGPLTGYNGLGSGPDVLVKTRGSQRDVVYLGRAITPSYINPFAWGEGGVAGSQLMSTAVHMEPK